MRILVTRSQDDAVRTAERLAERGHDAVIAPVTEIVPTGDPMPAQNWDALVVTSAHAQEALAQIGDRTKPVFAVGPHTASAVREVGFTHVVTAEGDAKSMIGVIRDAARSGTTLLHVTARHHKDEPAASLRAAGYRILQWEAYEAKALSAFPPSAAEALRTGQIGAALHYSRRSATIVLRLTEEAGLTSILGTFPHLCLSPDVAAPLEGLGLATLQAARPDEEALLTLLDGLP